jgi:uncharacterized protein
MVKIPTKIPQLDKFLHGGLTSNAVSCFYVEPGLDCSPFLYQLADNVAKTTNVFYIINSKSPSSIKAEIKQFGFKSKLNFIDSYSALIQQTSVEKLHITNPKNSEETIHAIKTVSEKFPQAVIILDSLSNVVDLTEEENVNFLQKLKSLKATIICSFTEWPYDATFLESLKTEFDTIIEVKSVQEKVFTRQYFGVTKLKNGRVKNQVMPYRVEKPGGIKIYIPKILVTGPFNAGKNSLVNSASTKAVSVDRLGTTIALDHGHVKYDNFTVDLFGTPGQQRFDPILKLLGGDALGVIVVVSAIDPSGFPRALAMMEEAKVAGLPVVFMANKINLRGAVKVEDIAREMGVSVKDIVPVQAKNLRTVKPGLPCELKDEDIKAVLDALFVKLLKSISNTAKNGKKGG